LVTFTVDWFGIGLTPLSYVNLYLIELLVGESALKSSAKGGVSDRFEIGGYAISVR
jgi:hypothetical protein